MFVFLSILLQIACQKWQPLLYVSFLCPYVFFVFVYTTANIVPKMAYTENIM